MLKVAALFSLKRARQRRKSIFGDIRSETTSTLRDSSSFLQSFFRQCKERWQIRIGIANEKTQNQRTQKQEIEKVFFSGR